MGPNELASLVVLLAMLRARLASARPERHFYTLSISWGMKVLVFVSLFINEKFATFFPYFSSLFMKVPH